jgi:dTDP-glucose pyrophosphorylase
MKKYKNILDSNSTVINALKTMNTVSINLLIVINNEKFLGLLSIGDIRRAILDDINIQETLIKDIMRDDSFVVDELVNFSDIKKIMLENRIVCLPVVDEHKHLKKVYYWEDIFGKSPELKFIDVDVVIMAGGLGKRLKPITNIIPKPLIPIGEKPIIEIIIDNFRKHQIETFYISVNYKANMIKDYLKEIESKTCKLTYFTEDKPLGTIGSLYLIKDNLKKTIFVSNCDIIIEEDYFDIYRYHKEHKNDITVVSAIQHINIPYGVMETGKGGNLITMKEKPELTFQINTGMYILEPSVLEFIPDNEFFHITDLIDSIQKSGKKIGVFPIPDKSWHDIGEWKEYTNTLSNYST